MEEKKTYYAMREAEKKYENCFSGRTMVIFLFLSLALGLRLGIYGVVSGHLYFGDFVNDNVFLVIGMTTLMCMAFSGITFCALLLTELVRKKYLKKKVQEARSEFFHVHPWGNWGNYEEEWD